MFVKTLSIRVFGNVEYEIEKIVRENPIKYYNNSHFIRTAIFKLLEEEKKELGQSF